MHKILAFHISLLQKHGVSREPGAAEQLRWQRMRRRKATLFFSRMIKYTEVFYHSS
jgi:hypothetical protein